MKKVLLFAALVLPLVFGLTGCGHNEVRVVEKTTWVQPEVDPIYLEDCRKETPPDAMAWVDMGQDERIDVLTRTLMRQYELTQSCTLDKQNLRQLLEKQKKAVADRNKAEEDRLLQLQKKE